MKNLKSLIAVFGLIILTVNISCAQQKIDEKTREEAKQRFEAYMEKLNLNDDQASKVEEVNAKYFEQLQGLRESDVSRLKKYQKYKSAKKEKDQKMKEILNKEQYAIYEEFQKELKDDFRKQRKSGS
ncbi:hypothetical protein QQ008_29670 [Fulvivirgaceae bacterium BMA10]|uniref:Uncharacterized protein n=1 Tax=Splendidivirga corallicola TaxID=3051826 RepID=A0ABT8L1V2_9BACT|nr:hypothetical protein [Fulvivirgaceae bacterium BMA10]